MVILEQLKFSVLAKHKWSAIALLNSILSSTESIEKRLSFRNILHCKLIFEYSFFLLYQKLCLANGLLSTLEQARIDADNDLNLQIDIFFENQKRDEADFLGHFDPSDNQAVCQAIQLQVC